MSDGNKNDGIVRLLVTTSREIASKMWLGSATKANWIESREHPHREDDRTWIVTLFNEDQDWFMDVVKWADHGTTIEEIVIVDGKETYELRAGEPGTGWAE